VPELGSYLGVPLVISAAAVAVVDDQGEEQLFPSMSAARAFVPLHAPREVPPVHEGGRVRRLALGFVLATVAAVLRPRVWTNPGMSADVVEDNATVVHLETGEYGLEIWFGRRTYR
jgi:hypothetical protein